MPATKATRTYVGAAAVVLLTIAAVILGFAGLNHWSQTVVNSAGEVCGSAWHFRPGHGSAVGGERTQAQLQAATDLCRQAAHDPYLEGRVYVWRAAGVLLLAALVIAGLLGNRRRR